MNTIARTACAYSAPMVNTKKLTRKGTRQAGAFEELEKYFPSLFLEFELLDDERDELNNTLEAVKKTVQETRL